VKGAYLSHDWHESGDNGRSAKQPVDVPIARLRRCSRSTGQVHGWRRTPPAPVEAQGCASRRPIVNPGRDRQGALPELLIIYTKRWVVPRKLRYCSASECGARTLTEHARRWCSASAAGRPSPQPDRSQRGRPTRIPIGWQRGGFRAKCPARVTPVRARGGSRLCTDLQRPASRHGITPRWVLASAAPTCSCEQPPNQRREDLQVCPMGFGGILAW
jgi:hypothetical protein